MFRRILQNQVPMMIMMIEMISMMMMMVTFDDNIDKAQRKANIMTFEANFTSFRNFYFVKKDPSRTETHQTHQTHQTYSEPTQPDHFFTL